MKCKVDNERSSAKCSNLVVKLVRTIKATGSTIVAANVANNNGAVHPWEENVVVATRIFPGVKANEKDRDYSRDISIFLDAIDQNFIVQRKRKNKKWSPEDEHFAKSAL